MSINLIKLSEHNTGDLYTVEDPTNYFKIKYKNIKALFKPDECNRASYIKWDVENEDLSKIRRFEEMIGCHYSKKIKSNILIRMNYPRMLNTKYNYNKDPIIIKGSVLSIVDFISENLDKRYDVTLKLGKVFVCEDIIKYPLLISNISISKI
tara:strand:- start:46 stop:501 length:456 start_codon:yes stop_codon:yes gene_type:complete